ncbi:malignant T-cell-amplified sequence 2 isoform X1 [Symphalangus syndactylus]|uniref:malignant T-cell-amplified sequence 2 isoform X1 n=1 Tax=Symphalangus syndactylus TaxID=9590 RepID=UPI0024424F93|nr:malignant T-cell-amplified sequence 2 [Symphalangus syndactylus]
MAVSRSRVQLELTHQGAHLQSSLPARRKHSYHFLLLKPYCFSDPHWRGISSRKNSGPSAVVTWRLESGSCQISPGRKARWLCHLPVSDNGSDRPAGRVAPAGLPAGDSTGALPIPFVFLLSPASPWIMFKKFDEKESVSNCIQLKTSVIKGIKSQLVEQFPDKKTSSERALPSPRPPSYK